MKNMKKLILGMVFLFGMSFSVNANAIVLDDCFDKAISSLEAFQDMGELLDIESATNHLNNYYADCIGQE